MPAKIKLKGKSVKAYEVSAKPKHHSNGHSNSASESMQVPQAETATNEHLAKANKSMMRAWDLISQRQPED